MAEAPAVAFVDPDPDWKRFDGPAMRVLLTLLEQALKAHARELHVVTVRQHHASVLLVQDRTPLEIAQLNLKYYEGMKRFLREGVYSSKTAQQLTHDSRKWSLTLEYAQTETGEGFTLHLAETQP